VLQHRTTQCASHGHREFTIQLTRQPPIPNVHLMLVNYFEGAVASGTKFLPEQIVRIGWAVLKLRDRDDGTIGVQERELTPDEKWTESVDRALKDTWLQKEVCASVGLVDELTFPTQDEAVMVADCAIDAPVIVMTRFPKEDLPENVSGWAMCCAEDHDHGERSFVPLLAVAANQPGLVQFLALPHDLTVLIEWLDAPDVPGMRRLAPTVFRHGEPLPFVPGSYLAALAGGPA
jgi:hypothetical protein